MTLKKIYRIPTLRNWHSCSVQTTPSRPSAIKASSMDVGHTGIPPNALRSGPRVRPEVK